MFSTVVWLSKILNGQELCSQISLTDTNLAKKRGGTITMREGKLKTKYFTRSITGYAPYPNYGRQFKKSFFPYITSLWNNLEVETQLLTVPNFKIKLKEELKPKKNKHFSKGSKQD